VPVLGADPIPAAGTSVPGSDPIPADGTSGPGADPAPASGTPVAGVDPAPAAGTSLPGADPSGAGPGAAAEAAAPGAPAEAEPDPDAERQRAYERSLAELLPSSPEEILGWRRRADQREAALGDSPLGAMRTRTQPVRLEPGLVPPLVELTPNLVTALVFTDAAGRPWPIASSVLGSASLFKAEVLGGESASQIILSPAGNHGRSNLIVTLRDQQVPLVIRLEARSALDGGRRVDGLIIFQIQASGPQSDPDAALAEPGSPAGGRPPAGVVGEALYAVLDGLLPEGGRILAAVPALDGETVVQTETSMFLRTRRGLLWPAPRARVSGPGGLSVFEIPATPTVLLAMGEDVVELSIPEADLGPDRAREDGRW
jgi:intracellular multiplication protein IcmK